MKPLDELAAEYGRDFQYVSSATAFKAGHAAAMKSDVVKGLVEALKAIDKNINRNIVAGEDVSMEILHYKSHVERALVAFEKAQGDL